MKISSHYAAARRALALVAALLPLAAAAVASEAQTISGPVSVRISPSQYRQSIADIFGPSIAITGRFEPETRVQGLLAIGAGPRACSDSGLERYDELARGIADQVVDQQHRDTLLPCKPPSATAADEVCARAFFTSIGRLLYRRPLTEREIDDEVQAAGATATRCMISIPASGGAGRDADFSPIFFTATRSSSRIPRIRDKSGWMAIRRLPS